MQLKNEIMLITYADSMGNNLKDFHPLPTVALLRCVMIGLTRTSEHLQM